MNRIAITKVLIAQWDTFPEDSSHKWKRMKFGIGNWSKDPTASCGLASSNRKKNGF